jgi:hypothetical protein
VFALSLVSYWISDDSKATLYAAIVVLESLGHAVGDPLIQQIFAASLDLLPFWQAMPFFVGAVSSGFPKDRMKANEGRFYILLRRCLQVSSR